MTPEDLRRAAELWDERAKICAPQSDKKAEAERLAASLRAMADAEPVAIGYEGWESLAWALCAEEHGEEACTQLIWSGGLIPEPWGDRWMKYEDEAKRLIALVQEHTTPQRPQWMGLTDEEIDKAQTEGEALFRRSKYGARGQQLMPSDSPDWWFARAIEAALRAKNGGAA